MAQSGFLGRTVQKALDHIPEEMQTPAVTILAGACALLRFS